MARLPGFITLLVLFSLPVMSQTVIHVNQVAYDSRGPKMAVVASDGPLPAALPFTLVKADGSAAYKGRLGKGEQVQDWFPGKYYYRADFSAFRAAGVFRVAVTVKGATHVSPAFEIGEDALALTAVPAILHFYKGQRANTPEEEDADKQVLLYGSNKRVDVRGGWCDASGDVSKYFSHLAYANFMSPQQIPLVTWSLINLRERAPQLLHSLRQTGAAEEEALWGADYMMRSLSDSGYFYMTVFSYFNKDAHARRIAGLLANSITTSDYQCAFREGGGMAIAALARIAGWKKSGAFTSGQYLNGAKSAFAHLLIHNKAYDDDGKENIIDDYCALMAATELWIATSGTLYRDEARKRAGNLARRLSPQGYFISDDGNRPFFHASDAGLPVVALVRYLDQEKDAALRKAALTTIRKALDYNLAVTAEVSNPYGYARQHFKYRGIVKAGFFIPHENETGWWWQGENARLGSLATAAITGGRLVYPAKGHWGISAPLAGYASRQLSWILGENPYDMCFMYGYGKNNVPYMKALYGHGTGKGGVSNGITGKKENGDGSGIDFREEDNGNEWRWTEQWIPHSAWFLQAVTALAAEQD